MFAESNFFGSKLSVQFKKKKNSFSTLRKVRHRSHLLPLDD